MDNATQEMDWSRFSLREIAERSQADKIKSRFEDWYEAYFARLRNEPIKILEIGVKNGGSIAMWERYFPKAEIFGVDIIENCKRFASKRTRIFIGDQGDPEFLRSVIRETGTPLDVIIDDGGHTMQQQCTSFEVLFEHVRPSGYYVVEDIHTSYREKQGGGDPGKPGTFLAMLKGMLDDIHYTTLRKRGCRDRFPVRAVHVYRRICFIVRDEDRPAAS